MNDWLAVLNWVDWLRVGAILHFLLAVSVLLRILKIQRNASIAIAWIAIIFALPFVGLVLYLLIGETSLGRQYRERNERIRALFGQLNRRQADVVLPSHYQGLSQIGTAWTGFGVYEASHVRLLDNFDGIFDSLLNDICQAKTMILMEFYIVHPKGRVLEIFDALTQAAVRGVECHLLADSVGSVDFLKKHAKILENAGIKVHESLPVGLFKTLFERIDLRNHRKIVAIDEKIGYTGSFNLVDPRFFKQDAGVGQWVDMMMRIEDTHKDGVISTLASIIATDIGAENELNMNFITDRLHAYTRKLYPANDTIASKPSDHCQSIPSVNKPAVHGVLLQPIPSAPQMTAHVIHSTIVTAIHRANRSVWITTPYFVPDDALFNALISAAKRGVDITLIVPKRVDSFLVRHASAAFYDELMDAGVSIAQFDKGLLHTKSITIDEEYSLFGTVNMDMRSFYINMEFSFAIYSPKLVAQILHSQKSYFANSDVIDQQRWQQRPWHTTLLDNGIRLIGALL
ncbi:MAG: cardiolipin synthase [Moraxella sp.]|nr:cardiolipin synthase [Moraxella sp.]